MRSGGQSRGLSEGQHWWEWGDYVDFVSPMYYTPDIEGLREHLAEYGGLLPCLYPMGGSRSGKNIMHLRQIDLQREYAPAGIYYWTFNHMSDRFLELLRTGPFRKK